MSRTVKRVFTLLEVLVAVTVLAIIMPVVVLTFATGLRCYRLTSETSAMVQDGRGALMLIQNDFQHAVLVDQTNNLYENKRLSLVIQAPDLAYQRRVTYTIEAGGLTREAQPLSTGDKAYDKVTLVENVELLSFEYRVRENWELKPTKGSDPRAVRVQLEVAGDRNSVLLQSAFVFPVVVAQVKQ